MSVADLDSFIIEHLGEKVGEAARKTCSPGTKRRLKNTIIEFESSMVPTGTATLNESVAKNLFHNFLKMTSQAVPDASRYSVLIDDISEEDFEGIGAELGMERLSVAAEPLPLPVTGIFWNDQSNRVFLPMTVRPLKLEDGPLLHVLFLVDPGSPHTYLRRDTLDALFPHSTGRKVTRVIINDLITPVNVTLSRGDFENVDLLGQDFMVSGGYDLLIKYKIKQVVLSEGSIA